MAKSPAHKFGQDLGRLIEEVVLDDVLRPQLESFTQERGYYLDAKGARPARRGLKVTWPDRYGNKHDLDFVIEIGGSPHTLGRPIAFIEAAWRRYTKHPKNKAQEIQGAVLPLIDVHREQAPFHGAVLAGDFTQPAVLQLRSHGFTVVHLSKATVVDARGRGHRNRFRRRHAGIEIHGRRQALGEAVNGPAHAGAPIHHRQVPCRAR
jgi:hypothetical protein